MTAKELLLPQNGKNHNSPAPFW